MKSHASVNRIYRLVWNAALGIWVAVAENAKGRGKGGRAASALIAVLAILSPSAYAANAADASVVVGAGSVATSGLSTTINQTSQRLAVDWTKLSTAANEALKFNQPNAQAIALNRIIGSNPSSFLGSLTANGQVFILNPNGVLFGAGSQVNVGGLVASTLSMSNADFQAGRNVFTSSGGTGSVVNQGSLTASPGGYLALLAPEVRNEGVMTANLGTALLAAGNKVTLNLDNGSLLGYSIDQGAINALAENKQLIRADGGQVILSAKAMDSLTTATVNNTGVIEARTIQNKAGRILLMGDMATGTVNVGGTLDASAPTGGDGGFIETSAAHVKVSAGTRVTTQATGGYTGRWLVDPQDYTVAASGGDMTGANLSTNLGTTNITLQSSGGGTAGSGDININDAVSWSANTLTLMAARDINFRAVSSATGSAGLVMNTSTANGADTAAADGLVKMALGPSGFTGRVDMATGTSLTINGEAYIIVNSLGAQADVAVAGALQGMRADVTVAYALGSNIDATATGGWAAGQGFTPLPAFSGRFNGLGHTISNMVINRPVADLQGLFAALATGARLGNVGMVGGSFRGNYGVGALVGGNTTDSGALIHNSYSTATVNGDGDSGGLVGRGRDMNFQDSYATGAVTGLNQGGNIGGLVGSLLGDNPGSITRSYATGNVGSDGMSVTMGGLVGNTDGGSITNSYATGAVTASGSAFNGAGTGGLVGRSTSATIISGSYATGNVSSTHQNADVGGLVGSMTGDFSGTAILSDSYATGNVTGFGQVGGGLAGRVIGGGTVSNSYATGNVSISGGYAYVGGLVGQLDNTNLSNTYATGAVLSSARNDGSTGGLVGRGAVTTIFNSYATGPVGMSVGGGNPTLQGGGLVGNLLRGSISGSYATGAVTGPQYVGGLVGRVDLQVGAGSAISGSYASGAVTNTAAAATPGGGAGGLLGYSAATSITDTYATGNVDGGISTGGTGGLVGGWNSVSVANSYATGVVSGPANRGGLGGQGIGTSFTNSFWNSTTSTALSGLGAAASNSGAAPLTSAQFKTGASFTAAGWSLASVGGSSSVWRIYEGHTAPLLRGLLTAVTLAGAADTTAAYNGGTQTGGTAASAPAGLLGSAATGRNAGFYHGYYSAQRNGLDITGGNLTITRANLTVSSSDVNRAYNAGTTAAGLPAVAAGTLFGSDLLSGGSYAFVDSNVGTGKTVNVSGITMNDGNGGGNYNLTQVNNTSSSIAPASLTVTANADNRPASVPYSGGNGVSYSGVVAGETLAGVLTGSVAYGGDSQGASVAGNYTITPGGLVANSNYRLNYIAGRLTLTGSDAASAALGKPELVGAYNTVLAAIAGQSGGRGAGGSDAGALAVAVAAAGDTGEE